MNFCLREPTASDASEFILCMKRSEGIHFPWVKAPKTEAEFEKYLERLKQPNQKGFLLLNEEAKIAGVFNISEIVLGSFQNGFLGFYATSDFVGKGHMSAGLKLVLKLAFDELNLHRLEANIQPENRQSIQLVKSNGFRNEGFSPRYLKIFDEWRDHERWAITFEDWKK
jgi:RimJ/RimL family protein N-acetyltransferase